MSLKPLWKDRALTRTNEPKRTPAPAPVQYGFKLKSFEEIRDEIREALKRRLPQAVHTLNNPTSVFSMLVDSIAQVDADQFKQIEAQANAIADFVIDKGIKFK